MFFWEPWQKATLVTGIVFFLCIFLWILSPLPVEVVGVIIAGTLLTFFVSLIGFISYEKKTRRYSFNSDFYQDDSSGERLRNLYSRDYQKIGEELSREIFHDFSLKRNRFTNKKRRIKNVTPYII